MKWRLWQCVAVVALTSVLFISLVKMTPHQNHDHPPVRRDSDKECRFQLKISSPPSTEILISKLFMDHKEIVDVGSCDLWNLNPNANEVVNKGMIEYGVGAALKSKGVDNAHTISQEEQIESLKNFYSGAMMKCGDVSSCVRVVDTLHDSAQSAGPRRRLLALAHARNMALAEGGRTTYSLGAAVASCGFLLIFVTVLCACHEKKRKKLSTKEAIVDENSEDITLNKITLRGSGAAYAGPHNGADFYATPSTVKEESRRNGNQDNGGLGHKRDDSRGSRCATLDRRLPAPPPSIPMVNDDLDPTYDVIPGEKANLPREEDIRTMDSDSQSYEPISRIYAVPEVKKSTEILYEEVNNTRPTSVIEDMMERSSIMESSIHSVHSIQSSHSAKHSYFSDSDERPRSNMSARISIRSLEEHYASPDEARMSSGETTPVADVRHSFPGSLYDEEFPPEPPPVPARRYGEDEIINSGILPEELLAPYVPPTIAMAAFPLLDVSATPAMPTITPAPIVTVIATAQPITPITAHNTMDYEDPPDSRYIQVTARESLASIRARQALQRHDYDNFYEPIDGDDPPPPPVRPISPPRASLDMYGADYDEINYAVPGNDDQSDTGLYSDIKGPDSPGQTPVPPAPPRVPPLHAASLMENTSIIYADADSPLLDRRNRSLTTGALPRNAAQACHRDPVYAVPNKEHRRARSDTHPDMIDPPLYAQVDKPRKKDENENQHDVSLEASASVDFDVRAPLAHYDGEVSFDKSPSMNGSYEGVRLPAFETEVRTRPSEPPSDRTSVDSGLYQRVDIDEKVSKQEIRYSNLSEDANYSVIPHEEKNLAREQMFHMSNHKVADDFWVRQEHVYQELDEEINFPKREIPVSVL